MFLSKIDLPPTDAAHIEEIVDQPYHLPQLALHRVACLPEQVGTPIRTLHDLQHVAEWGERVAQFVCQGSQELVFAPVGLLESLLGSLALGDVDCHAADQRRPAIRS